MKLLVTGAARSGKSGYAEKAACSLSEVRTYLATMQPGGSEAQGRIEYHRRQRAHLGFRTIEQAQYLDRIRFDESALQGVVLLEDLGNLVANSLFDDDNKMGDADELLERLDTEVASCINSFDSAVVVTNEIGSAGILDNEGIDTYMRLLGSLSCQLAQRCDSVVEVVAGVPSVLKGSVR